MPMFGASVRAFVKAVRNFPGSIKWGQFIDQVEDVFVASFLRRALLRKVSFTSLVNY